MNKPFMKKMEVGDTVWWIKETLYLPFFGKEQIIHHIATGRIASFPDNTYSSIITVWETNPYGGCLHFIMLKDIHRSEDEANIALEQKRAAQKTKETSE